MVDKHGKAAAGDMINAACASNTLTLTLAYYDAAELVDAAKPLAGNLQGHFQNGGYYSKAIFFLAPLYHRILPRRIQELIVLDSDLKFTTDVWSLQAQFRNFAPTTVMSLAYEQQPVYKHVLWEHRRDDPKTTFGMPPPHGFPGFNSGVILMNLARMRASPLYNSVFTTSLVKDLSAE